MVLALADGSFVFIGIFLLGIASLIWGFYTRRGSGIEHHPSGKRVGAPGAVGRTEESGRDHGDGLTLEQHGTR